MLLKTVAVALLALARPAAAYAVDTVDAGAGFKRDGDLAERTYPDGIVPWGGDHHGEHHVFHKVTKGRPDGKARSADPFCRNPYGKDPTYAGRDLIPGNPTDVWGRRFHIANETIVAPLGKYIDVGIGIAFHPNASRGACVRTVFDTVDNSPVFVGGCSAGSAETGGGRWDMTTGYTAIRNVEATSPDFCLTANARRTAVHAARCAEGPADPGKELQIWYAWYTFGGNVTGLELATLRLGDTTRCLSAPGNRLGDAFTIEECDNSPKQVFYVPGLGQKIAG